MGSSILLMEGAPGSQNVGCWQHHDSLLKGDVELLKLLLKPSRLQILVAANWITPLWLQHLSVSVDADVLTAVGVWLLASPLLMESVVHHISNGYVTDWAAVLGMLIWCMELVDVDE
ncbi:hypothetical protein Nepgr_023064 [Nepenthes gracilis]|uniref:Uncharacterized protein n=1 Tax=Nepenthes gracilis TaxID=150966 RepID=A0AAD3XXD6_NEPGR|nr:hypothetical protein Nepgr_023064 [Nepenthes gracilis]